MNNLDQGSVTNEQAASAMANGHPKSKPPSLSNYAPVLPGSPGSGAAPGANGPPTTGAIGPGGPMSAS